MNKKVNMNRNFRILLFFLIIFTVQQNYCKSFSLSSSEKIYDNPNADTGIASVYLIGYSRKGIAAVVIKFNMNKKFKSYGYFFIDTVSKKILEDYSDIYSTEITTEYELFQKITPLLFKYGIE